MFHMDIHSWFQPDNWAHFCKMAPILEIFFSLSCWGGPDLPARSVLAVGPFWSCGLQGGDSVSRRLAWLHNPPNCNKFNLKAASPEWAGPNGAICISFSLPQPLPPPFPAHVTSKVECVETWCYPLSMRKCLVQMGLLWFALKLFLCVCVLEAVKLFMCKDKTSWHGFVQLLCH